MGAEVVGAGAKLARERQLWHELRQHARARRARAHAHINTNTHTLDMRKSLLGGERAPNPRER